MSIWEWSIDKKKINCHRCNAIHTSNCMGTLPMYLCTQNSTHGCHHIAIHVGKAVRVLCTHRVLLIITRFSCYEIVAIINFMRREHRIYNIHQISDEGILCKLFYYLRKAFVFFSVWAASSLLLQQYFTTNDGTWTYMKIPYISGRHNLSSKLCTH